MTGFVVGSLVVIWPWKTAITKVVERVGKPPKEVITSYEWFTPQLQDPNTWIAVGLMILGALAIALMERVAGEPKE